MAPGTVKRNKMVTTSLLKYPNIKITLMIMMNRYQYRIKYNVWLRSPRKPYKSM